jgi:hypothetical protein
LAEEGTDNICGREGAEAVTSMELIKKRCVNCIHWNDRKMRCRVFKSVYQDEACPAFIDKKNKAGKDKLHKALRDYSKKFSKRGLQ